MQEERSQNPEESSPGKKASLAVAIAHGESVSTSARENGVSRRTAYRWVKDPKVERSIDTWRRRVLNQAIGRMASRATEAADGIATLAKTAESESVQLRAWRAILADQMAVAKFSRLEGRLLDIEERLAESLGEPTSPS